MTTTPPASGTPDEAVLDRAIRRATWRLVPFLILMYMMA